MSETKAVIQQWLEEGKTSLGIELGSTRIKAVLIGADYRPIVSGEHDWENSYVDGIWTYSIDEIWAGIQDSYKKMADRVKAEYGVTLTRIGSIGFSAMMHGYMAFDQEGELLVPFRTWRNNITGEAAEALTKAFDYPIPQRWSVAHLYQAILNKEEHVADIAHLLTLAGYVQWQLTDVMAVGVGEASGMFPIDLETKNYNSKMIEILNKKIQEAGYSWSLSDIMPKVAVAGEQCGILTEAGAKRLDPSGSLEAGIPFCPPEGDAGTGMVATNTVLPRTGNVSAGTSVFAMVVLEGELSRVHTEIDLVTTPDGKLVGMAHSNNCTSNLDAWVSLFDETLKTFGLDVDKTTLYKTLYNKALDGDKDGGGLLAYGYLSGEHMTHFEEGRPLFARSSDSTFDLANFMRVNLMTSLGALKIGMDILLKEEKVQLDKILGHGGFFKTEGVGQRVMAAAVDTPVTVMDTAGEGGAWGIAVLASYLLNKEAEESLGDYLENKVFHNQVGSTIEPTKEDVEGFEIFMERYKEGLPIERAAVDYLKTQK